jgi:nitrogen-specific signal transduction histidine kinase
MTPSDLSGIIYDLRDTVPLVELQGTVVAANLSASRLFRRPSLELVGKPLSALLTDEPETLSAYLRQRSQSSEGIQRSLNIQPANEPMEMKLFQDLALHSTFASFVHCKDSRC